MFSFKIKTHNFKVKMGKIIWDINLIKLDEINLKTGLQWVAHIDHESWISWKLNYKDELKNAEWASSFSLASESAFWQPVLQEQEFGQLVIKQSGENCV